jgi:AcrR family transcriptional regulator
MDEGMDEGAPTGLRERNRVRRERAIRLAGLRLFAERGYDATSLADIAAAADVSPRTVSLYFPAKLDIALGELAGLVGTLVVALRDRPPGEPTERTLERWLRDALAAKDREASDLLGRLLERDPGVRGLAAERIRPGVDRVVELATEGFDPAHRPFLRAMVGAAATAVVTHLLGTPRTADADLDITAAVRFLGGGLAALGDLPSAGPVKGEATGRD